MTERATIFQTVILAPETTAGSAPTTDADIQFLSTMIEPAIQFEAESYRGMGFKFPGVVAPNREWVQAGISGAINYNELTYLLASLMATPTPAQQGGTDAYQSTFTIDSDGADTYTTYYVQQGSTVRAHEFNYGIVTEVGLSFARDGCEVSGTMIGQRLTDDAELGVNEHQTLSISGDPTGGTFTITYDGQTTTDLTYDETAADVEAALEALSNIEAVSCTGGPLPGTAIVIRFEGALARTDVDLMTTTDSLTGGTTPESTIAETTAGGAASTWAQEVVLPTDVCVYVDSAAASLGTTLLTRCRSANWNLGDRYAPGWYLNCSENSWIAPVETEPNMTMELNLQANSAGMAYLANARAGDTRFIRIEATSDTLADTGYYYKLTLDMAGKIEEISDFSDDDGIYTITYTFRGVHDSTWGKAVNIDLINVVDAL